MKDCKEKIHMNILCKFQLQEMMQALINRLMQEVSNNSKSLKCKHQAQY